MSGEIVTWGGAGSRVEPTDAGGTAPPPSRPTLDALTFRLVVSGKPRGKARPRFGNGRAYSDPVTEQAEADIRGAWVEAGSPRLEGAIGIDIDLVVERPKGHFTTRGALSADGRRSPYPSGQKPDVDNALKLVLDALNGRAWKDDVQVVRAAVVRYWGKRAATVIYAREIPAL